MSASLISLSAVILLTMCWPVKAQLWVNVYNQSSNESHISGLDYSDITLFSDKYSNVGDLRGFLHLPVPRNACSYIEPLPPDLNTNWFALVTDYPSCPEDMLVNVRAAGYKLIITSPNDSLDVSVTHSIKESGFPIIIVSEEYSELLEHNVSYTSFDHPVLIVEVVTSLALSVFIVVFSFFMCCLCCCITGTCCCVCKNRRSRLRAEEEFLQYRDRQYNYEQVQRRERMARQELIESILRQLQELQVDLRTQTPLGATETGKLPTRPYRTGQSKCDSCAICVEEFVDGETLRWLPCDHCFHPQCIDEWLTNHSCLCPLCKTAVSRGNNLAEPVPLLPSESTSNSSSLLASSINSHYGSV